MTDIDRQLGAAARRLREAAGFTMQDVAERMYGDRRAYNNLARAELGQTGVSAEMRRRIEQALGVPVGAIEVEAGTLDLAALVSWHANRVGQAALPVATAKPADLQAAQRRLQAWLALAEALRSLLPSSPPAPANSGH